MNQKLTELHQLQIDYYKMHLKELEEWKEFVNPPNSVMITLKYGESHFKEMIEMHERMIKREKNEN